MSSSETPSRSKPALFNANLFSTPSSTSSSGLSSLGFGEDIFSGGSPFIVAPAAPRQSSTATNTSTMATPTKPSDKGVTSASLSTPSHSTNTSELSTIPLDSPSLDQMGVGVANDQSQPPSSQPMINQLMAIPGSIHGWNDPPFLSSYSPQRSSTQPTTTTSGSTVGGIGVTTLSEPSLDAVDSYHIQPLVGQRRSESPRLPTSFVPPTSSLPPQAPPPTEGGANPYRLGGKKPTVNMKLAYDVPSVPATSQAPTLAPPTNSSYAVPSNLPPPAPPTQTAPLPGASHSNVTGNTLPSIAPVQPHWFYLRSNEEYWFPFSIIDSSKLEEAFIRSQADPLLSMIIQTDGGRYDVDLKQRLRAAVYWEEPPAEVRRCTWFYKGDSDRWYLPYTEEIANKLEEAYTTAIIRGSWNSRVDLPQGEAVMIHSPSAMVHYSAQHFQPLNHEIDYQPKAVLRGFVEREKVEMGEDRVVDHLVFIVHGIEPFADARLNTFRSLIDCVDDFREVAQLMLKTHKFGGQVMTKGRVEFLPVHWHSALLENDANVDKHVRAISLPSISRLRDFTNNLLVDILFYSSPLYLQRIVDHVSCEMNRMLEIFQQRNPNFSGNVSVMGHSLGSCILFDLLYHQTDGTPPTSLIKRCEVDDAVVDSKDNNKVEEEIDKAPTLTEALSQLGLPQLATTFEKEEIDFDSLMMCSNDDMKEIGIPMGPRKKLVSFITEWSLKMKQAQEKQTRLAEEKIAHEKEAQLQKEQQLSEQSQGIEGVKYMSGVGGTGKPLVFYPQLNFQPSYLFCVGSPIGLFLTIRGVETLGPDYQLPTCPALFNIYHPFDPIAYRLEPLIIPYPPSKPVLMPHHKGRKRFHLELYENLERVSQSVRYHLVEGIRNMWHQLNELARAHTTTGTVNGGKEEENEMIQAEVSSQGSIDEYASDLHVPIGKLNGGNRIDHVLQEKPIEKLNEYLFALSSHLCYWRSEDTALFILKEIYNDPHPEIIKS